MALWQPSQLRTGELHFLFDLEWAGSTFRLSDEFLSPVIDGVTLNYAPGLDFAGAWEQRLALFALTPSMHSIDVTLDLSDVVDVPARIESGHDLGAATATLYLWLTGTTERRILMVGNLRRVQYGAADEPVTATIEEAPLRAPGLIPSELQRMTSPAETATQTPSVEGQYFPIIFGRPGGADGYGSPALTYSVLISEMRVVLAAHECIVGTVDIVNDDDGSVDSATLRVERDANVGSAILRSAATFNTTVTVPTATSDPPYYIRWNTGAGLPSRADASVPARGAGEILTRLLEWSGARVDHGRLAALEPTIDGFRLDAAIIPGDTGRVAPTEWIHRHLLPILPISANKSGDGLYYTYWNWGATATDAVLSLSADEHQMERVGLVEYSAEEQLYHAVRFDYGYDYRQNTFTKRLMYTGDRSLADTDSTVVLDQRLEWSFTDHAKADRRKVRTLEINSEAVLDDATAHLVCQYLARRYGLKSRLLRYEASPETAVLEPGDVVTLTDEDLGLDAAVGLVESAVWTDEERFGIAVRLLASTGLR